MNYYCEYIKMTTNVVMVFYRDIQYYMDTNSDLYRYIADMDIIPIIGSINLSALNAYVKPTQSPIEHKNQYKTTIINAVRQVFNRYADKYNIEFEFTDEQYLRIGLFSLVLVPEEDMIQMLPRRIGGYKYNVKEFSIDFQLYDKHPVPPFTVHTYLDIYNIMDDSNNRDKLDDAINQIAHMRDVDNTLNLLVGMQLL
jgi:hypothetical protein